MSDNSVAPKKPTSDNLRGLTKNIVPKLNIDLDTAKGMESDDNLFRREQGKLAS